MTATVSVFPRAEPSDHLPDAPSPEYIAIVDDDESVRRAYARLIGAYSFHVQTFASGTEFIGSLSTGVPACLIVDLQMPDMTGLEVLHRLSYMRLRIPSIVVTARDEPGVQHRSELCGATALLVKPVMGDELLRAIGNALKAPGCQEAQSEANS